MKPAVMTQKERKKFANAQLNGVAVPKITAMSFGVGGVDSFGNILTPSDTQTAIAGEFFKTTDITVVFTDATQLSLTIEGSVMSTDPNALNQFVSSCGLWDSDGDLAVIKNFGAKQIEDGTKVTMTWAETF